MPHSALNSAARSAVRVSCQTMARVTGRPVSVSHSTVVARWLVMPIAVRSDACRPAESSAFESIARVASQISFPSCSTRSGPGWYCGNSV